MREFTKRAGDLIAAAVGLLVLAPLMGIVAITIKRASPGPVLFTQWRVGRDGVPFRLYKFRTMRPDVGGPSITSARDSRITPIGRWLRRCKLDELPQLVNVLRGEMSLVGPRPEVPEYVRCYSGEQRRVLSVRPGITGPAQIWFRDEDKLLATQEDPEAYYVTTLLPAKLAIDLEYVGQHSLPRDFGIVVCTLLALWRPPSRLEAVLCGDRRQEPAVAER